MRKIWKAEWPLSLSILLVFLYWTNRAIWYLIISEKTFPLKNIAGSLMFYDLESFKPRQEKDLNTLKILHILG